MKLIGLVVLLAFLGLVSPTPLETARSKRDVEKLHYWTNSLTGSKKSYQQPSYYPRTGYLPPKQYTVPNYPICRSNYNQGSYYQAPYPVYPTRPNYDDTVVVYPAPTLREKPSFGPPPPPPPPPPPQITRTSQVIVPQPLTIVQEIPPPPPIPSAASLDSNVGYTYGRPSLTFKT